ncbi:hypothetical protein AAH979_21945 [Plantactinospora sp. ZYX-F-223]|uniref:hypothetical protein n=1 Tax=Plantactinospora sp. ZYX-F-223 TaxID=3144103 RepID=UPI0031FDBBA1
MSLADPVGPGRRTDRREAVSFTIELPIAGNITTTHHLASSMKLLAETDGLAGRLRAEPALIPRCSGSPATASRPQHQIVRSLRDAGQLTRRPTGE